MKRVLQEQDRRRAGANKKRAARALAEKAKRRARRKGFSLDGRRLPTIVKFPAGLSIQNKKARKVLLLAIKRFKEMVGRRPVYLDFSEMQLQYPSAVLLLVAEIDRQRRLLGSRFNVDIIMPRDEVAAQVLYQVGIAALCGRKMPKKTDHFDETVRHWRYSTGTVMTDVPGKNLDKFEGRLSDELHSGMWKGVSEAIINSVHHAYLEARCDGHPESSETRWWMFSQVRGDELTVAVCDLGIGIPRSLPLRWGGQRIQRLLAKFGLANPEVSAVRAALEVGATRTGQDNRGRGLPQIWSEMKQYQGARILLMSNRALLYWCSATQEEREQQYAESIFGTLVIWTVPLSTQKA